MKTLSILAVPLLLAGCGGSAVAVPEQFAGTWGADCSAPWVRFAAGKVHDFPGNADYPLKTVRFANDTLAVRYVRPDAEVTDTYATEGDTLRLLKTVGVNGGEATWNKLPMRKCS